MNHVTPPTAWTAEDAGARFDELARRAREEGPQRVTLDDGATVLVTPERPPTPTADESTAETLAFLQAHWFEGLDELLERDYPEDREPDLGL